MAVGEFELINRYFKRHATASSVLLGVGDDCAVLQVPQGRQLVVSVDTLLAGVHFPEHDDPQKIASRALCVSLSDLAAMAAEPHWFTLCLTLPEADENWLAGFSEGLYSTASRYGAELVGGDTTRGPLAISLQVMGSVVAGDALRRNGAQPGNQIFVTGTLGDAAAALAVIQGNLNTSDDARDYLMQRYYHPRPRFDEARAIGSLASAAIDVSDGLAQDLGHICTASDVGAELDLAALPISAALERCATAKQRLEWALHGGDDYQLCFTVPPQNLSKLEHLITEGLEITHIGEITANRYILGRSKGELQPLQTKGYQHFG